MANLFTEQLSRISVQDIRDFLCLSMPENLRPQESPQIDYKEGLPQDLGDAVAALSNTYGGLIFVGVKSDKKKQNIPIALDGVPLGGDVRARLADKINATVNPRPDYEVQPFPCGNAGDVVVLLRVRQGSFPPYEFAQSGTIRIPVRIQDTNRQATVREIEALFALRGQLTEPAEDVIGKYFNPHDPLPMYCTIDSSGGQPSSDNNWSRMVLAPRAPLRFRLDSKFEREFELSINSAFQRRPAFSAVQRSGSYIQKEFRQSPVHRMWRAWFNGGLAFAANHSRIQSPEPVGNLVADLVFFLRLAGKVFEEHGFYGRCVLSYYLSCPSRRIACTFPPPGGAGDYDQIDGIYLDQGLIPFQSTEGRSIEETDCGALHGPEEIVTTVMSDQLRHIFGARVVHDKLLQHVKRLADDQYLEMPF